MAEAVQRLERLRQRRARLDADASIGGLVSGVAERAARTQRRLGALTDVWESLVPAEIVARTRLTSLRGGVARVVVDSASTAYELDRMLRGGLEQQLRRRFRGTLMRIRISIGERYDWQLQPERTDRPQAK
ncbi:MAG: DUF721 domain-containing protein [Planctomycetes bacterium]|nr:DUF721 domain-containing protein [Planctomycetota bacterium]